MHWIEAGEKKIGEPLALARHKTIMYLVSCSVAKVDLRRREAVLLAVTHVTKLTTARRSQGASAVKVVALKRKTITWSQFS